MTVPVIARFFLGTVTLITGALLAVVAVALATFRAFAAVPARAPVFCLITATLLIASTTYLWFRAAQVAEGDDLFSGERGLVTSLMAVTVLILAIILITLSLHQEFWRGMFEGAASGMRS